MRPRQNGRHFEDDIFKCLFNKKNMNFDYDFTEDCSLGPNEQYSSIGLDNNLARGRRQAMIWTKVGYISDAYMRHPTSIIFLIVTCPFPPKTIQQTCIDGVPKNMCYFFRRRIFPPNRGDMWRPGKFGNSISSQKWVWDRDDKAASWFPAHTNTKIYMYSVKKIMLM